CSISTSCRCDGRCGSRKYVAIVPATWPLRPTSGTLKQARNPPSRAGSAHVAATVGSASTSATVTGSARRTARPHAASAAQAARGAAERAPADPPQVGGRDAQVHDGLQLLAVATEEADHPHLGPLQGRDRRDDRLQDRRQLERRQQLPAEQVEVPNVGEVL